MRLIGLIIFGAVVFIFAGLGLLYFYASFHQSTLSDALLQAMRAVGMFALAGVLLLTLAVARLSRLVEIYEEQTEARRRAQLRR
jgi:hypothetical protein